MDLEYLMSLQTSTLFVLGLGYACFRIAYAERVGDENSPQTVFLTLCFAAITSLTMQGLWANGFDGFVPYLVGGFMALFAAVFWRTCGMGYYAALWRTTKTPHIDGLSSVLDTIRLDATFKPATLTVILNSGTRLWCEDMKAANAKPFGPCLIGADGSVSFYPTHVFRNGSEGWAPLSDADRDQLTIIPSDQILQIKTQIGV